MTSISTLGAIAALVVAIVLILRKVSPAYGMMAGALVGGLIGGADLLQTVSLMVSGAQGIVNAVLRILAAGVLAQSGGNPGIIGISHCHTMFDRRRRIY